MTPSHHPVKTHTCKKTVTWITTNSPTCPESYSRDCPLWNLCESNSCNWCVVWKKKRGEGGIKNRGVVCTRLRPSSTNALYTSQTAMLEHMCRNQSIFGCCKLLHVLSHRVETLGCREWLLVRLLETECHLLPVPLPVFPGHVAFLRCDSTRNKKFGAL